MGHFEKVSAAHPCQAVDLVPPHTGGTGGRGRGGEAGGGKAEAEARGGQGGGGGKGEGMENWARPRSLEQVATHTRGRTCNQVW